MSAQTDNDSYAFTNSDRYYSNGIFLSFRKTMDSESNKFRSSVAKKIFGFSFGHEIYMPYTAQRKYYSESLIDRPYAGYISLTGNWDTYYKNESALELSTSIGFVGPSTNVQELQSWTHEKFGYYHPLGWNHQIQNAFGANAKAGYQKKIVSNQFGKRFFDMSVGGEARVGTFFNGASVQTTIRLGALEKMFNSLVYNAKTVNGLSADEKERDFECAFYIIPMLNYVAYDATIQGNIFESHDIQDEIIKTPAPFVFNQQIGFMYTKNRWGLNLMYNYRSKETKEAIKSTQFGSFKLMYFFN
ncbi:lipid A deacylase LpxR family protein [Solitalea sp. MAHUQ-68]|uniref:Lipid A deacylase LpxR family protein n=1 Tax=Solitalea agri TaxID=2953739 RepID=A0A9X2EZX6_9SPHI|nr:lipid A deacylase LpxR family protein [Solitalea agri]MCO4291544.1 lipid A deacylase LpxR family protein [Solitalea agri]